MIEKGSIVKCARSFLKSAGIWQKKYDQKGQVITMEPLGKRMLALVEWDDGSVFWIAPSCLIEKSQVYKEIV